ncbi:MAG TPA: DinB family protein [Flavisolibacter sp.]|jgi:uncharacterized damage-inducible protein DinB|nr:DinB family protein [Flavisolibacter sp.]
MITELANLLDRDLFRLEKEIGLFSTEALLWTTREGITNSAGNLCLHIMGNLKTYIGHNLGGYAYRRDREAEFSSKDLPKEALLEGLRETRAIIHDTFQKMTDEDLTRQYPENVLGYEMTTGYFLIHLTAHLSYHLGQVNYLRSMLM